MNSNLSDLKGCTFHQLRQSLQSMLSVPCNLTQKQTQLPSLCPLRS